MNLFLAEWKKITGNRWLVGCLIYVWPLAAFLIVAFLTILMLSSAEFRESLQNNPTPWTDAALLFWAIPNSIIGRLLVMGFTAALFAGEYQWGTWKHLLPREGRIKLILAKFVTLAVFIIATFSLTSLVWMVGLGFLHLAAGADYPPAIDDIPADFGAQLAAQIVTAFVSTLAITGLVALVALVTRSILASLLIGILSLLMDGFIALALIIFYAFTDVRAFLSAYRFTITYNVDNLLNWANFQQSSSVLGNIEFRDLPVIGDVVIDPPIPGNTPEASLLLLLLWMLFWVGLTTYSFYRQDITT